MKSSEIRERLLGFDKVTIKKDGTVEVRATFFYKHGRSVGTTVDRVKKAFPNSTIVESYERWQQWPRESYWLVRFALGE